MISGECFCGAVAYEIAGKLHDARSCHCSRCRKAFGAQASAYDLVHSDEFRWVTGVDLLTTYVGDHGFGMQFCSRCGSTLCGIHQGAVHGIALGCVNVDLNIEISRHIFVGSKAYWEVIPSGVTLFDKEPPDETQ